MLIYIAFLIVLTIASVSYVAVGLDGYTSADNLKRRVDVCDARGRGDGAWVWAVKS